MKNNTIKLSPLPKTWILDIDGTIVKHNGYLTDGQDTLLLGAAEFLSAIPETDMIIFITSRTSDLTAMTERLLDENRIRYDHIIYNAPYGERVLMNDRKPSGLDTAIAINTERDVFCDVQFEVDNEL